MCRYSLIRTQQAQRLAEARAEHQRALQDAEYSFAKRDRATAAARAAAAAEAQCMLRAQQGFRAHPVPEYIRKVRACLGGGREFLHERPIFQKDKASKLWALRQYMAVLTLATVGICFS